MVEKATDLILNDNDTSLDRNHKFVKLKQIIEELGSVVVAYSGGVDSTFLLKTAVDILGDKVLAVTGDSETVPRSELENACRLAELIGANHKVISTNEMCDPDFVANAPDRCYHCKKTLFSILNDLANQEKYNAVIEGSNYDDISDYRPGFKAVKEYQVRSPLCETGLTKADIRYLSQSVDLPTWDKPAAPCLSSRIPYGTPVTKDKLIRIEAAEAYLRELGFSVLRVRDHGDVARIEVPRESVVKLIEGDYPEKITKKLKSIGYKFVSVDLIGFRSGSLNEVLKDRANE